MGPEMSEVRRAAAAAAVDEMKENRRRLRSCGWHRFEEQPRPVAGVHLECIHCKGQMPVLEAFAYVRGYMAAGNDPRRIAPWWESRPAMGDTKFPTSLLSQQAAEP